MRTIRYIFCVLLQASVLSAIAQKQHIRFEHLESNQGLSQNNVTCILQDSRGFMWFGTVDGLNKYDGYKFTVYKNDPQNKNSLSNNTIEALLEDEQGNIWIGTGGGGINKFDWSQDTFTRYMHDESNPQSISNDGIRGHSMIKDSEGNLWIGTTGGLNMLNRKTNKFVRYIHDKNDPKSLGGNDVTAVMEDSQHNIWVGSENCGLGLFNKTEKNFSRFQHDPSDRNSLGNNNVRAICEDSRHRLWIGTYGGGVELFDKTKGGFYHFKNDIHNPNSLSFDAVISLAEGPEGNIWIGTENGGVNILNPETELCDIYTKDYIDNTSLSNNSIYSIYKDRKGNMWVGTFSGGVNLVSLDANKFASYRHNTSPYSLSNNNILSIYEDAKDNLWIGTDGGGVNLFDRKTGNFTHFKHDPNNKNSICGNYVVDISEDAKRNLWIATYGDGLTVFNKEKNTFKHFKNNPSDPSSISNNNCWMIFKDSRNDIWIGTREGGLNLFNSQKNNFTHYKNDINNPKSICSDDVINIFEDSKSNFWVGTGGGLNLFDRKAGTFTRFSHDETKNSLSNDIVNCIFEDSHNNLWIGTDAGLNCLDRKTNQFSLYSTADGLLSNVIHCILEDAGGNLWLSTNEGLSRFNARQKTFENFTVADGLQADEFKQASCKSRTGMMYFGGINGFNEFFPAKIKTNSFEPPLVITGFQIFNREVAVSDNPLVSPLQRSITETKKITLPYSSAVISFEFASLNYTISEKKQYAYMLENSDSKWNQIGTRRTATYTNLDPGEYVFKVKGLNNDGTWSSYTASVQLTITPPFWLTWWFKVSVIVFILGCFAAFYGIRMKVITKQKAQLEKQVKERTTEVVLQKEELSKNVQELAILKEALEKEKYFLDSLMDNMPDSIYFKDQESKMIRISKYMADHFGATVDDLIGKSDFDFQDKLHAAEAYQDEQNIQKTGKPKIDYIEKETKEDGSECWISTTKMPLINAHGEVVGTFGMSRDVTKVKKLERERHEAELDKAVAQGKFEIASDVMHDIGNAVVGFGSYLTRIRRLQNEERADNLQNLASFFEKQKAGLATSIGETKADAVIKMLNSMAQTQKANQEEINKSITEQLNIVTNIQEILNIQRQYITGHESQERKPVNMRNIINDSLSMLFASLDKMAIAVSLNIASDLPIIKGDRTKLMQALLNIFRNSIEAIGINAPEKNISVSAFTNGGQLILQVKDTGNGFDQSTAGQLFGKGFTTKSLNSGMGLYNCKAIFESHEGTLAITSDGDGKGALATIGFKV